MSAQIRLSVLGCGYWGPNLIRNFRSLPECNIKHVCDLDPARLAHMQQLYPEVVTTTSYESVVTDVEVDAIIVATPVHLHFPLAKKALLAGKHVFIEKPMASSVKQCMELNALAQEQNVTLMVGHTFIYSPTVRMIKEIVASGELGEIFYISAQRLNLGLFQKDINVAWDLAPHDISIILHLLNQAPAFVNCQGKAHIATGIEDITNMTLGFSNGSLALIQSSWLDPNKIRKMTIVGSKRMILYDDTEPLEKIRIYDKRVEAPPHYDTFGEFQYAYHYGDIRVPYLNQVEPLKSLCQHFIECIQTGTKPESSGREGLQVVQILEAASESLRRDGARIDIARSSEESSGRPGFLKSSPRSSLVENDAAFASG